MELTFQVAKCVAWAPGLETEHDWRLWQAGELDFSSDITLPSLKTIPPMQRRRLSPFAKVSLHCALEASDHFEGDLPCVFSSRHGDLNRTTKLIENVAEKEGLSPTQFGLSVHNAVSGLYSIYTKNHAPISAVAAGKASFLAGLIDSLAKLQANQLQEILYVYSDLSVPDCYLDYVDTNESVGIGMLLKASKPNEKHFTLQSKDLTNQVNQEVQSLDFLKFYYGEATSWQGAVNNQAWTLTKS
ncbi:beta-ketoacyl synthase chain length factor [Paraglaciecola sp. 2405UD69-4]|uniref:beta-ketoacyl synthase chain length factor n=1 Tax=Paraglaciecola sp. 2405UD69-4 TaxID=3391836 RepID=UPI0039C9F72E